MFFVCLFHVLVVANSSLVIFVHHCLLVEDLWHTPFGQ